MATISSIVPGAPTDPLARPATPDGRGAALKAATGTDANPPPTPQPETPFGYSLRFDNDTHRFILESRDPVSGFVVFQFPSKYATERFGTSTAATPPRGGHVDGKA